MNAYLAMNEFAYTEPTVSIRLVGVIVTELRYSLLLIARCNPRNIRLFGIASHCVPIS